MIAYICAINLAFSICNPANADVVTDWNNAALDAIRAGNTAPPIASRSLAILHVSIYDAVNGITRTHEKYLVPSAVPASASEEAAASAAAHKALVNLFPANVSSFDTLYAAILATIPNSPHKTAGIVWGRIRCEPNSPARANDGSYIVPTTWRQRSWRMGAHSSPFLPLFVATMGIRRPVWNEQQFSVPPARSAFS